MQSSAQSCCVMPAIGAAKSETARIEILHGKQAVRDAGRRGHRRAIHHLERARDTVVTADDGTVSTPAHPGDIANWEAGAVQLPRDVKVYKVRFYCAARRATAREIGAQPPVLRRALCHRSQDGAGIHPDSRGGRQGLPGQHPVYLPRRRGQLVPRVGPLGRAGAAAHRRGAHAAIRRSTYRYQQPTSTRRTVAHRGRVPVRPFPPAEAASHAGPRARVMPYHN